MHYLPHCIMTLMNHSLFFISHLDNSITDDGSNFEKFLIMNYEVLLAPALIKKNEHTMVKFTVKTHDKI